MARVTIKQTGSLDKIAKSGALAAQLEPVANTIMSVLQQDPNEEFVASLRKRIYVTGGRGGRVSWQIGAHPVIGSRVQAKRGVFTRALGRAGL